jgi:hypothetical protein
MLWQVSWDGECRFYCLLSLKSVNRWDGFWQPFGAVNENKQSLPAGWKFIDDSHRSRWRQIAETLVEERSILISFIKVEVKKKYIPLGWNFSCFAAYVIERDLF